MIPIFIGTGLLARPAPDSYRGYQAGNAQILKRGDFRRAKGMGMCRPAIGLHFALFQSAKQLIIS